VLVGRDIPTRPAVSSRVELRLAGTFGVIRDGTELSERELGSRKSRTLLKLLAVQRPGLLPVDRIVEVLWPGEPPAAAEQNVATLVSRLRGVLGAGVILGGRSGYRLADSPDVGVDLDAAARYCEQAERKLTASPAIALVAVEQAIGLLAGDVALADEPYSSWVDPARDELRGLLRRARLAATEAALAADDAPTAARYAEAAIAADPLDEAAYRWYMSACAAAGEPAKALVAYAALRERLAAELGADPASPTQELHLAILREQPGERPDRRQAPARPHRRATRLAGRDEEIATLREAWSRAIDADEAEAAMRAGIEINRRGGYPQFAAWYVAHLGWLARLRGRDDEAVRLGRQALTMTDQYEHSWWEAAACAMLGTTLLLNGDRAGAIELFERGLPVAEEVAWEAHRLRCLAPLAAATGSAAVLAEADRLLGRASIPVGGVWFLGEEVYLFLAQAWLAQGDPERARAILAPLLVVAERVPWTPTLAATLAVDGHALVRLGQDPRARAQLQRAENLAREHGLRHVLEEARSSGQALR
jgi:DNA-binding SARP family transcriptional activator